MISLKRILAFVLLAGLAAGCGSGKGGGTAGKVKVTFWHAMGGPLGDALDSMVQEFERANPGIDIDAVSMGGYSSLSQKLMGAVQVEAPPNMAQMYESWTAQFHGLGELLPLDTFAKGPDGLSEADLADFYPAFIADNTWDGTLVTLPFNKSVPVFFYNIEMLKAAGYPEFPKTWLEFRAMVKKLTVREKGIWGTTGGVNEWMFGCMLRQLGGDFIDEAAKRATFNSAAGVKAAEFMHAIVAEDSSAQFTAGYDPQNDFLSSKIAVIWGTSVSWTYMRPTMTFPVGIAAIPTWDTPNVLSFGTNIGVFRTGTSEQAAACWKFIKWFTGPEAQAEWAARTSYVPARRSSLAVPAYAALVESIPGLKDELAQLEWMSFEPRTEAWFAGRRILGEGLEKIMRGDMKAKAALDEAAAAVNKELAK
jgi:ABC-type glycerol-3-phosphate transport system substrate-binding protein